MEFLSLLNSVSDQRIILTPFIQIEYWLDTIVLFPGLGNYAVLQKYLHQLV